MREIKFRGKRADNGEWVYGSLCKLTSLSAIITTFETEESGYMYDVFLTTVGQYTGIEDKNGREIYEGDIVHFVNPGVHKDVTVPVVFERGDFCMEMGRVNLWPMGDFESSTFEKIGNIHDNPELLKH